MFGYVKLGDNQVSEEEFKVFSSYYCGVCRATGKVSSQIARLGLSYDISFLALVLSSLTDSVKMRSSRCIVHPLKARTYITDDTAVSYAAAVGVLLNYLKLCDDWHDEKNIGALISSLILHRGCFRVKKIFCNEYEFINRQLDVLSSYEKIGSASVDDTSGAFGEILGKLFTPHFVTDINTRRALEWFGFNLGKWIYTVDAIEDIEKDLKSGSYNPFVKMGYIDTETCAQDFELTLTLMLDGVATAFELINFGKNRDLIAKIVYISLKDVQNKILNIGGKDNDESVRSAGRPRKCGRRNNKKSI